MSEVVENSLQYLTPSDITALVTYLRDVTPRSNGMSALSGAPSEAGRPESVNSRASLGEQLFVGACSSCHLDNGQGRQTDYAMLTGTRTVRDPLATNLTQIILHGSQLRAGNQRIFMPSFGNAYSDVEIAALSNYVVSHFGEQQGRLSASDVANRR